MPHQDRLVDLGLPEPGRLLAGEEHLDSHLLPPPAAQPHLAVPPLPHLPHHLDLLSDGPLDLHTHTHTHTLPRDTANFELVATQLTTANWALRS